MHQQYGFFSRKEKSRKTQDMPRSTIAIFQSLCLLLLVLLALEVQSQDEEMIPCPRLQCRSTREKSEDDCRKIRAISDFMEICAIGRCGGGKRFQCGPVPLPPLDPVDQTGRLSGDPHVFSFDGQFFDCQARGEFTLVKNTMGAEFEIQARFAETKSHFSLTTGIVISHEGSRKHTVFIPTLRTTKSLTIRGCPIGYFRGDSPRKIPTGTRRERGVTIKVNKLDSISFDYTSGLSVKITPGKFGTFGCNLWNVQVRLSGKILKNAQVRGVLGTPNGDVSDDWRSRNGSKIPFRSISDYKYCSENWCITDPSQSLFEYEDGTSHSSFMKCGTPEGPMLDLTAAGADLKRLCGDNPACLLDGIAGGKEAAFELLKADADHIDFAKENGNLQFFPPKVANALPVTVRITLDFKKEPFQRLFGVQKFKVYQIDRVSGARGGLVFDLVDDGSSVSGDARAKDRIFSSQQAIQIDEVSGKMSFEAIPVVRGREIPSSELRTRKIDAITSFSQETGLGESEPDKKVISYVGLTGLELVVIYTWKSTQVDLDSATEFASDVGGPGCFGFGDYVTFLGDVRTAGGSEIAVVDFERARRDGVLSMVTFSASWFQAVSEAAASLTVVLRDSRTKREVRGKRATIAITPVNRGTNRCSTGIVATLDFQDIELGMTMTLQRTR